MPPLAVSVVTVTHDSTAVLPAFLDALATAAPPAPEVIVVDCASRDGSADVVRRALPAARVLAPGRNLGFAGGSNLGARAARGDILVLLNPDTVPPPGAIGTLAHALAARPRAGALGCKLVYPDGRLQSGGGVLGADGVCAHRGYGEADRGQWDVEARVDYVPGAALAIRRDLFLAAGGFWEGYFPGFYEDVELCLRLRARGWDVVWLPAPAIVHSEGHVMTRARAHWLARNRLLFLARNPSAGSVWHALRREPLRAAALAAAVRIPGAVWQARRAALPAPPAGHLVGQPGGERAEDRLG